MTNLYHRVGTWLHNQAAFFWTQEIPAHVDLSRRKFLTGFGAVTTIALTMSSLPPIDEVLGEEWSVVSQELLAYRMPLIKIIEDQCIADIMEIEDARFLAYIEQAIVEASL